MPQLHLFDAYGVELEYMIVDRDTLAVKPIADELLKKVLGYYGSDYEYGIVTWSNELVLHVIELKSSKPEHDFQMLENDFVKNVREINSILTPWNAQLMPTAAHPFMNPLAEARLWPHDNNEVYSIYNQIFDCRGHGWSNLQSTHLNLPFTGDEEFAKLHAAIRLVLPILPALCASSPVMDGKLTGLKNTRLQFYKKNQQRIPFITGLLIPEAIFSEAEYTSRIYDRIKKDIAPFNQNDILDPVWVNSRGAIPRFDRGSIEIRLMDVQECPAADLAILTLVIETLKALVNGRFIDFDEQCRWQAEELLPILEAGIEEAEHAVIGNQKFLLAFGLKSSKATAGEVWNHIYERLIGTYPVLKQTEYLKAILSKGSLASRITSAMGKSNAEAPIAEVYRHLIDCLNQNRMFLS